MEDKYYIYLDDNIVELVSEEVSFKITSDRMLWVRKQGEAQYANTNKKVYPERMNKLEKAKWLADLRMRYLRKMGDARGDMAQPTHDDVEVTVHDDDDE